MRRGWRAAPGCALALVLAGCGTLSWPWEREPLDEEMRRKLAEESPPQPSVPAPARSAVPRARELWLDVARPVAAPRPTVHTGWVEVSGHAGTRENLGLDVVIVLDVSGSTRYASGADVNGNGIVGTRKRPKEWEVFDARAYCSDPGDTVLDAEREATRRLIGRLDPERTRIGLVSFSDLARPRAPLGSSRELLFLVLDDLAGAFGAGPTNLSEATRLAVRMLRDTGEDPATAPEPVVLILSDGYPTHPESEEVAAALALEAAHEAALSDVRITSLTLGLDEPRDPDVFAEMAEITGGEAWRVATPGDVLEALPALDLTRVASLAIENTTTGEAGRALRVRPDGRFDAWVRLRPGENRLRVTARGEEGGSAREERVVIFDDGTPPDPEEVARIQKAIELRTLELELLREVREGKQRRVLVLEGEAEAAPSDAEDP